MDISPLWGDLARNEDQSLFENLFETSTLAVGDVVATGAEAIRAASTKSTQKRPSWPKKHLATLADTANMADTQKTG